MECVEILQRDPRKVNESMRKNAAQPQSLSGATSQFRLWCAWAVHAYTALGAVCAFAGVVAAVNGDYRASFLWMIAASVIDGTDGVLARAARVSAHTPAFDGARLDDIVDYLTFVFLPVFVLYHSGAIHSGWGLAVAAGVLLSSAYGFASADAKTSDHFFTGFPSYWNVVAVYLYAFAAAPVLNAVVLVTLSVLVFVRIGYVYPTRTPVLRRTTLALAAVWAVMILAIVLMLPGVPRVLLVGSLFFPIYYTVLSFVLHFNRSRR
jgi:phosphatidylcholine synthase